MSTDFASLASLTQGFEALNIGVDDTQPDRVVAAMDRPEVLNAIDQTMVDEFHTLCQWLEANPRTLIITGTTNPQPNDTSRTRGIYASGAAIAQLRQRRLQDDLRGVNSKLLYRIKDLPMPVIAAIDCFAMGGVAELAWTDDYRVATTKLRFGQPEM